MERSDYLRALLAQKKSLAQQDNVLVNPSIAQAAALDTSLQGVHAEANPTVKNKALNTVFGTADELAFSFGSGYVNGWEGGLDLGANLLSWATGENQFSDWARQDFGAQAGRYIQTYANFTPWAIFDNAKRGNYRDSNWWGDAISGAGDLITGSFGGWDKNQIVQSILSGGVSAIMAGLGTGITALGNLIGGRGRTADSTIDDYGKEAEERYGFDNQTIQQSEGGQFVLGITHSIGEMLPSIQTGSWAANAFQKAGLGAKAVKLGSKAISTGFMGLSAAGHGSNEALEEGATKGQAIGYGLASGLVEAATEWIFPDGGVGGSGVGKGIKKGIVRELAKEMVEEGVEEIVSELASPVLKMIYDSDAYQEYATGDYWKQVALAGASGSITGGLMSGVGSVRNYSKYGSNGVDFLEHSQNLYELDDEYRRAKTSEEKAKIAKQIETETKQFLETLKEMANDKSEKGKKHLVNVMERLGGIDPKSNLTVEQQVQENVKALEQQYKNIRAKGHSVKYSLSQDDADKIMSTPFEKDGVAKKYEMVDGDGKLSGVTFKEVNPNSSGAYLYAKKPLREATLAKQLPFDKVSSEFNIPTSLEKTYSQKLNAKNPLAVIQFIAKYGETDVDSVLEKLGFDAFEYKDGRVVISNGNNIIEGDIKYGDAQGKNGDSSLIQRLGRKGSYEELQGYLGKDGSRLETHEQRQRYSELVRQNRAYKQEYVENEQVSIIDESVYTDNMREIAKKNNKLGAKTFFILAREEGSFPLVSGFYDSDGSIYHIIDASDYRTIEKRNAHEVCHFLEDRYYAGVISNIYDLFNEWKQQYPEEYQKFYNRYEHFYRQVYKATDLFEEELHGEILAEIYSEDISLSDEAMQDRMIRTLNKVAKLGEARALEMFNESIEKDDFKPIKVRYTTTAMDKKTQIKGILASTKQNVGLDFSFNTKYIVEDITKIKKAQFNLANERFNLVTLSNVEITGEVAKYVDTSKPLVTNKSHLFKNLNPNPNGDLDKNSWHNISPKEVVAAIEALNKPDFINEYDGSIIVLTDVRRAADGEQISIVFEKNDHEYAAPDGNIYKCLRIKTISPRNKSYKENAYYKQSKGIGTVLYDKNKKSLKAGSNPTSGTNTNIAEENKKVKYTVSMDDRRATIGVAVTYDTPIDNETFEEKIKEFKPYVQRRVDTLAKAFGVQIEVGEAIGGWTFTDNANQTHIGGEPSFPLTITGYKDVRDVKLIASIIADTAFEVQNSVGVFEYTEDGTDIEDTFSLTKVDEGLNEIIKQAQLEGYTLKKADKQLIVVGAEDKQVETLLAGLKEGGYLNGEHKATKCNTNWLNVKERADLYEVWLKDGVGKENRLLRDYVSKAKKVNGYVLSNLDEEGHRKEGTINKSKEISDFLKRQVDHNRPKSREIIKNTAELKHDKVYTVKSTREIVDNALTSMLDNLENAVKISIPEGKNKLTDFAFEEINTYKDRQEAVKNIVKEIESAVVTFKDGENKESKVALSKLDMHDELTNVVNNLLLHKGELSEKSKWVRQYMDTLNRYAQYVHERAVLTSEFVNALDAQKKLDKIFENTKKIKMGGDATVKEISLYKKLVSDIRWSRTEKNVAPSTFTKLVNNFAEYTKNNYEDYYDEDLKMMVDMLAESFKDGKFPNREPTVYEMHLFNSIRGRIIQRCNDLASEKTQQRKAKVRDTVVNASVALPAQAPKNYGTVGKIVESSGSLVSYLENHVGAENKFTKLFSVEYLKKWGNSVQEEQRQRNYVFETLPQEAGFKKPSELANLLKQKVYTLTDRVGRQHKLELKRICTAYLLYNSSSKEELLKTGLTIKNDSKSGTNIDFKLTAEDYENMFEVIPAKVKTWLDLLSKKYYNGMLYDYRNERNQKYFGVPLLRVGTYFPSNRVGQVNMGVANTSLSAGYLSTINAGYLKERVHNKNHFLWNNIDSLLEGGISDTAQWGEMADWVEEVRDYLNTTVPEAGNHTLEYYLDNYAPDWKKTWSQYMDKLVLGKPILEKEHNVFSAIGNAGQLATLGINIGSMLKQLGSSFNWVFDSRVSLRTQLKAIFLGFKNLFKYRQVTRELKLNSGFFIERWENGDLIRSFLNNGRLGKVQNFIAKVVLSGMEFMDKTVIVTQGYEIATEIVDREIRDGLLFDENGNRVEKGSEAYNKARADLLAQLVVRTQSNSVPMWTSRLRSGDVGWIQRDVFGRFGSDNQNKIQMFLEVIKGKRNSDARADALEKASNDSQFTEEQREMFRKAAETERAYYKKKQGRRIARLLSSLLLNGMAVLFINELVKRIKGKKDWDEAIDVEDIGKDLFLETFVNWIPYVGTFANAIENNTDVSSFTLEKMNNLLDTYKAVASAFEKRDEKTIKRAVWAMITSGLELTGVPANNMYQLFMGAWYQFDKEGSLTAQSWVKGYQSSYMKSQVTSAANNGQTKRAQAELGAWSSMYSTGITNGNVLDELVSLTKEGYSVLPNANMTSYTDENGDEVSLTKQQVATFNETYKLANAAAEELLKVTDYKTADAKIKSKTIKSLFDAYYNVARARVTKNATNLSKAEKLIYYSSNKINITKYLTKVNLIRTLEATDKKSKKEVAVEYINKLKGFTKQEKLLLMYLSGYSVKDNSLEQLKSYLTSRGVIKAGIKEMFE